MTNHAPLARRRFLAAAIGALVIVGGATSSLSPRLADAAKPPFKILHIMSYHSPWEWTDEQFRGFKDRLTGVDVEYKVFQLDMKRNSAPESKASVARQARQLIDTWKPDLIYTNDDLAQELVAKHYVNTKTPIVFSAVNADPQVYGFRGSTNVAGVLEHEHFVQSVELLRALVPNIKKVAVVLDGDPTWTGVVRRMKEEAKQLGGIEFVSWDVISTFDEYKQKILGYAGHVDAIASLGIFMFTDARGKNVPFAEVIEWTAKHSMIPDFSFWESRIGPGTLAAVTVSGYAQGSAAGTIARGILVDGKSPASFKMEATVKGEPMISLARARKLGIAVNTTTLLTAKVIDKFDWDTSEAAKR